MQVDMKDSVELVRAAQDAKSGHSRPRGHRGLLQARVLNKANRILEVCDRLTKAKRDGTLEWIAKLK